MQEGECRSPAPPLHQYSNEQLSVQKQSTIGNNKNQQHGKKSQQDEDSPKNSNKKSKSNLSEKKEIPLKRARGGIAWTTRKS